MSTNTTTNTDTTRSTTVALELRDISVTVPDGEGTLTILDRASLVVERGEVVAVFGESGSGKSTLLAVAGLLRTPTSGTVTVDGRDASAISDRQRTQLRGEKIGLVFQQPNLFPSLSALEQLELVAHIAGNRPSAARDRATALLGSLGLERRMHARPAQLSGGEQQRVGIARALMRNPVIVLADEPTASLDDERGRDVIARMEAAAGEAGVATVLVTHNRDQVGDHVRSVILSSGTLSATEGTAAAPAVG